MSLVPSLTELVWWLGRGDALVGRTRFCTEPAGLIEGVPIVGGTKNPKVERIVGMRPDLVLANKEENRREDVEVLREAGLNIMLTNPNTVSEALDMVTDIGSVLQCAEKASELVEEVRAVLAEAGPARSPRVFVAVWKDPLLGMGSESYGHDLVERAGGQNVLANRPRYPELTREELIELKPELILLPDEPYPFKEAHRAEFSDVADTRLVDGKLLWWYGPRMADAIRQLRAIFSGPDGVRSRAQ